MFSISTLALVVAVSFLGYNSGASAAQQQPVPAPSGNGCVVIDPKPADPGYKTVGFRRPKAVSVDGVRATTMTVQSSLPADVARSDAGMDDPKILEIEDCSKAAENIARWPTAYKVRVDQSDPDWDQSELPLPSTLPPGTKFMMCWADQGKKVGCGVGVFKDFDTGVTIEAGKTGTPTKLRGKYKF